MSKAAAFDLVVIGGGPAGYVAAIRAAQLGMSAACVERDALGGVCLNWGCIPTKALLAGAEFYNQLTQDADAWGIQANDITFDWAKVIGRSRTVAANLNKGIGVLFRKHKITHIDGHGKIVSAPGRPGGGMGKIEIHDAPGRVAQVIEAKHIVIATGATPRALPGTAFDGDRIITSKEAMSLPEQPKSLVIVGAGPIGMEFAYFYHAFGTQVTVIEMEDRLLPGEDDDVSKAVAKAFRRSKLDCRVSTKTQSVKTTNAGVEVKIAPATGRGKSETLRADRVLVAIGVTGRFDGLFEESLGITIDRGHIKADRSTYQTTAPGVYAVGDVIGPPWLAHVASEEAVVCVERIAGHDPTPVDYDAIPGCTYCQPQVASVGLTERACKEQKIDYQVGTFPFQASGKAQAMGHTAGFIKLIVAAKHGELLGAHMVGEGVTELIAEMGLAMRLEATADEVIATMHAHPTLSEAVHEAALGTAGRMIHF